MSQLVYSAVSQLRHCPHVICPGYMTLTSPLNAKYSTTNLAGFSVGAKGCRCIYPGKLPNPHPTFNPVATGYHEGVGMAIVSSSGSNSDGDECWVYDGKSIAPTTHSPSSVAPSSHAPSTANPTSHSPTVHTNTPTTHAPSSHVPTSHSPSSHAPTSHAPAKFSVISNAPSSHSPTSHSPVTSSPTAISKSAKTAKDGKGTGTKSSKNSKKA